HGRGQRPLWISGRRPEGPRRRLNDALVPARAAALGPLGSLGPFIALRALYALGALRSLDALRAFDALVTLGPPDTLPPGDALRTALAALDAIFPAIGATVFTPVLATQVIATLGALFA